ncbi:Retrovirus-related Pol polyprotein from type-2 retrotransposable element R2DM [Nymphaea thermarum]|nr:Retrovirus-related Pol polyprotein from type-2 retrotransposable element R2DM [Nymphaea thermarum]
MPSIINPFQAGFIKGRHLQDAVVLANEVVHSLYCLQLPSFILKLDISKAFDSVSWEFLSDLLTRLAFDLSFRQWILSLVTGAQLAISFNGKCGNFFCLGRGLCQGCPLSPLLFNLVAKSSSALFYQAMAIGFLTPHTLPHLQTFSTIQYADDFLMFADASRQQIVRTWLILRVFELRERGGILWKTETYFDVIFTLFTIGFLSSFTPNVVRPSSIIPVVEQPLNLLVFEKEGTESTSKPWGIFVVQGPVPSPELLRGSKP